MACLEHMGGTSPVVQCFVHITHQLYFSAEALVQMIISDIRRQQWNPPSWFPRSYLTDFTT